METATVMEVPVRRTGLIDILLVGGRRVVRERLRRLFDGEPGLRVVGDASNAGPALAATADLRPDVVVVVPSGAPLARTMRALKRKLSGGCHVRTIVLTNAIERTKADQARELGVSQVVSTAASPELLIDTVRHVAADVREPFDHRAARKRPLSSVQTYPFGLTKREMEVIEAVVRSYLTSLN
jgi:two-component system invasion response regulator UvrY